MKVEKVAFISADLPYWNLVTHAVFPEYGMPLVATIVRNLGYDVRVFVEHIGPIKWDQVMDADVICFHAFSSTMPKTIDYIERIKSERPDLPVIIGGTHASVMAEDTLQYCDIVVRQEGDETLPEVLERLKGDEGLDGVLGVSYWDNGQMKQNPNRPFAQHFDVIPDLELISGYMDWPKWKLLWNLKMRWQVLQTTRGCPYDCSFCIAPRELGRGYRLRSVDSVIADIKYQRQLTGAYRKFYGPKQIMRRFIRGDFWAGPKRMACNYWAWDIQRSTAQWADYLESVQGYYYDENDRLIEERLGAGIHPAKYPGSTRAAGLDRATIMMGS